MVGPFSYPKLPVGHPSNPYATPIEYRARLMDTGNGFNFNKTNSDQFRAMLALEGTLGNYDWKSAFGHMESSADKATRATSAKGYTDAIVNKTYVFGKQNNFYYLKAGLGQQHLIGGKGNKNGVAVSAVYGGGLSLGYLKPYYLNVQDDEGADINVKYVGGDSTTKSYFLDPNRINGATGFTKGFAEGKFVPGAFAKVALRFDYGRFNEFLSAFEVGLNGEFYTKTMPIMINNPEKRFFLNGYIAIEFGNRK